MWFYYLLLAIAAAEAGGHILQAVKRQNVQSNIKISGTGTIINGKTLLNINVQIDGNGGLGGAQPTQTPTSTGTTPGGSTQGGTTPTGSTPGGSTPGGTTPTGSTTGGSTPGGSTPEGKTAGAGFTSFEKEALKLHNKFRSVHAAPPMTLDKTMCDEAAAYAAVIAKRGFKHSNVRGQGENLSMGCSTNAGQTATQAVTNWYNEVCNPGYDFGSSGSMGTGHFTQVVWKASTKLGIGKFDTQKSGMKCTYIVGRYKPQGNFNTGNDDYQKNVLKGSFEESYCNTACSWSLPIYWSVTCRKEREIWERDWFEIQEPYSYSISY